MDKRRNHHPNVQIGDSEFLETPSNGLSDSVSGERGIDIGSRFRLTSALLGLYQCDIRDSKTFNSCLTKQLLHNHKRHWIPRQSQCFSDHKLLTLSLCLSQVKTNFKQEHSPLPGHNSLDCISDGLCGMYMALQTLA